MPRSSRTNTEEEGGDETKSKNTKSSLTTSWFGSMFAEEANAAEVEVSHHHHHHHQQRQQQSRVAAGLRTIGLGGGGGDESHQGEQSHDISRTRGAAEAGQPSAESTVERRGGGLLRKRPSRIMCTFAEEVVFTPATSSGGLPTGTLEEGHRRSNTTSSITSPDDGDGETKASILEAWKQVEEGGDDIISDDQDVERPSCSSSARDAKLVRRTGSQKRFSTSSSGDDSLVRKLSLAAGLGLDKLADEALPAREETGSQTSSSSSTSRDKMGSVSIQQELEAAREALAKLQSERDEEMALLRSKHEILQQELQITKEELMITKERAAEKHSAESMLNLEEEVDDLEEECKAQAKMKELVEQKNKILEDTLEVQSGELAKCLADLACRDDELKDLREDVKALPHFASEAELDDMRRRYRVLEEENGSLQEEIEGMAMQADKNQRGFDKARQDLEGKEEELKSLRVGASRSIIEVRELRGRITELQLEKVALADEVEELGEQLEESFQLFAVKATECNTLTNKLEMILDDQDECDSELQSIQQELVIAKGRVKMLERENRALKKKSASNFRAAPLATNDGTDSNDDDASSDADGDAYEDIAGIGVTDKRSGGEQKRGGSFGALQNLTELFSGKPNDHTSNTHNDIALPNKQDEAKDDEIRNLKRELERRKAMSEIESSRSRRAIDQLTYQIEDMTDRLVDTKGQKAAAAASARLLKKADMMENLNSSSESGSTDSFTAIMKEAAKISDLTFRPKQPGARTA